jgi:hypothetical protein
MSHIHQHHARGAVSTARCRLQAAVRAGVLPWPVLNLACPVSADAPCCEWLHYLGTAPPITVILSVPNTRCYCAAVESGLSEAQPLGFRGWQTLSVDPVPAKAAHGTLPPMATPGAARDAASRLYEPVQSLHTQPILMQVAAAVSHPEALHLPIQCDAVQRVWRRQLIRWQTNNWSS